jgi:hypothetical protein
MPLARTLRRIDVTIGSDDRWIGLGLASHRIRLGLACQPFEFEPEYNGDQAINNRMPPSCPRHLAPRAPCAPLPIPTLSQAPPCARILPQEVGNTWEPKPLYTHRFNSINLTTLEIYSSVQNPRIPWPPRSRMPPRFSCRTVETQLDDISSKPDSGAIFVALLIQVDTFETTTAVSFNSRICPVLAWGRF